MYGGGRWGWAGRAMSLEEKVEAEGADVQYGGWG